MIKLLAFDTSSSACSIALQIGNEMSEVHRILPMQQAQFILPLIHELLLSKKINLNQLDAICVGCGPGSFTGVRVAVSVAQGISYGLNLPVIPISSLAALAQTVYEEDQWATLWVAVDARMEEVYSATYIADDKGIVKLKGEEKRCAPGEVVWQGVNGYGIGDAWTVYPNSVPGKPLAINTIQVPKARAILSLARLKYQRQAWVSADRVRPVYLQDQVAKKNIL